MIKENYLAVCLGKKDIGEADRRYVFYTKEKGLFYVRARGVRKSSARLAAHIEDYMLTHIAVAKNQGPGTLAGAYVQTAYLGIRSQYDVLCLLGRMRDVFIRVMRTEQPDDKIFELLFTCLEVLEESMHKDDDSHVSALIIDAFLLKLFEHMGYRFPLTRCAVCSKRLEQLRNFFSPYDGGVICHDCIRNPENHITHAVVCDVSVLKVMRIIAEHDLTQITKVKIEKQTSKQLQIIIDQTAVWIMR